MHAKIMKDQGIIRGLVQDFETSDKRSKGAFYGFRKMFWTYLNKLGVPFYDSCCALAPGSPLTFPVRFNSETTDTEYFNGTDWVVTKDLTIERTTVAIDATATATAAQVASGVITSTSAAATSITLPSATDLATELNAVRGTSFDFIIDNGVGANTVTVIVGAGTAASSAIIGGTTLTVASGVVGQFRLYFQGTTTAKLSRIA